jgi:hypothetical protein
MAEERHAGTLDGRVSRGRSYVRRRWAVQRGSWLPGAGPDGSGHVRPYGRRWQYAWPCGGERRQATERLTGSPWTDLG